ncbi:Eukaryotic peptide chain release factor GTP-binding subunit [Tulasnella sp. UAMH 9824]|nr:Eukaryotic peptide chain release factor GTP-binding subunit [Tulasnella sp. UAMH 9824]
MSSSAAAKADTPTRPSGGEALSGALARAQRSPSLGVNIPGEPSTPRTGGAMDRSFNLSSRTTTPTVHVTSPIRETSSLQATPLSAANTSTSSAATSPVTPGRGRQGSQTHAGGILPPASFFRASRPNSSTNRTSGSGSFNFPGSPPKSSPLGGIGIGLPFKASSPSSTSPLAPKGSGLPSTFKTPNLALGGGDAGARMTKPSREPLLPAREQQAGNRTQASVADTSASSVGGVMRGSFERIWRKGGADTGSSTPPRRSVDRRSQKSGPAGVVEETEMAAANNMDLEAGPRSGEGEFNDDATPQPSPLPEDRNRFVQDDTDRLTVDDIGDGALGGGVVMEMGRWSLADAAIRPTSMADTSVRTSYRTGDGGDTDLETAVIGDAVMFRRSQGAMVVLDTPKTPKTPRTPGGGVGAIASFSFDTERTDLESQSPPPNSAHPLAQSHYIPAPSTPGQQSRHAHFAPSPHRSPKNIANGKPSSSSTSLPTSHNGLFHRSSEKEPSSFTASPPYMVPVMSGKSQKPLRNYETHPSRNKFFFNGHILAGGDSALPFIGALVLLLGVAGTWLATTCVFWWHRGGGGQAIAAVGAYLILVTLSSMLMTAFRDPGILPRDLDPDPPCAPTGSSASESQRVPLPRDLRVRAGTVVVVALCIVVMWPLLALTLYHVRLLLLNITTIEQVRNQAHRKLTNAPTPPNPFTIGRWWHNVAYLLCRPAGYSWVDLPGYSMSDTRKVSEYFASSSCGPFFETAER